MYYLDGNSKEISWEIQTKDTITKQKREHVGIYKDNVTNLQSKYIALHVGLFWGIGVFIIKNEDNIKIKLDEKIMYDHLKNNIKTKDEFIEKRTQFIKQLVKQRELEIEFELIDENKNLGKNKIAKELKTKND